MHGICTVELPKSEDNEFQLWIETRCCTFSVYLWIIENNNKKRMELEEIKSFRKCKACKHNKVTKINKTDDFELNWNARTQRNSNSCILLLTRNDKSDDINKINFVFYIALQLDI